MWNRQAQKILILFFVFVAGVSCCVFLVWFFVWFCLGFFGCLVVGGFFCLVGFSFVLIEGYGEALESVAHIKFWKMNRTASRDRNRAKSQGWLSSMVFPAA